MPSLLGGTRSRSCAPCTTKRPAGTGTRSSRLALTQSLASTVSNESVFAISAFAALLTSSRNCAWSGASAKCTVTSQRPSGRSNAATAASPSKKISVSTSTMRFAACSSPMAKLARWVEGVTVIGKCSPQLTERKYRSCLQASHHHGRTNFTTSSPCSDRIPEMAIRWQKAKQKGQGAIDSHRSSTAYPTVFHKALLAFHRPQPVNVRVNSSRIHPDSGSAGPWNRALSAMREHGRANNRGGSQMKQITVVLALMLALSAYVSYPSADERAATIWPSALMSDTHTLPIEAFDAV